MTNTPFRAALSRREFLRAGASGAAGLAAWSVLGTKASPAAGAVVSQTAPGGAAAIDVPFNDGWLFGGPYSPGSRQPGFDDAGFVAVTLPHTVTPLSWRNWSPSTWEKVWVYRRHFPPPPAAGRMRTFIEFQGALTSASPAINGAALPEHYGGYLPFSYELTDHLLPGDNVLAVKLDSTWQNVPPDGYPLGPTSIDYLEPGGLYRNASLKLVPQIFLADLFAKPTGVLSSSPGVQAQCVVDAAVVPSSAVRVVVSLSDAGQTLAQASVPVTISAPGQVIVTVDLGGFGPVELWSPSSPHLYQVTATVTVGGQPVHDFSRRIGFREAVFQTDGFFLNGQRLKLFGLNRHQLFPYSGMAMPDRVQVHDALRLKRLNCNMVRMSHYPQAPAFLDACDELGIMLWEETPGWGYLGDSAWQAIMMQNVHDMVVRDRSRPSVIIWGVSPNEARRDPTLYAQSQDLANSLDGTRQTSGSQTQHNLNSWNLEVFAFDDYNHSNGNARLLPPISGVPYLVTEAVGTLDGAPYYRWIDDQATQQQQAMLHAQVHNIAGSNDAYCGLLGWCAYDYDSLNGNIFEAIKWPGVVDTFRVEKPGAAFYLAQGDPAAQPVIDTSFYWDFGPVSPVTTLGQSAMVWSNCERLEAYLDGSLFATLTPDTTNYPHLAHPPFYLDVSGIDGSSLPDLRLDGFVGAQLVTSKSFSADHAGDRLALELDDHALVADGYDATRIAFRAVDRFGNPRPYPAGDVSVSVTGPAVWLGEVLNFTAASNPEVLDAGQQATVTVELANGTFPFQANGGVGGIWVKTLQGQTGQITVSVSHPTLGAATAQIEAHPAAAVPGWSAPPAAPVDTTEMMTFRDVKLSLQAPAGWVATPTIPLTVPSLPPGAATGATWTVTAPAEVTSDNFGPVIARAAFDLDGSPVIRSATVPLTAALPLTAAFDNVGISNDDDVSAANFDGVGNSFSAQLLAAAGLTPGASFTSDGVQYTWPDVPPGSADNVVAKGQTIMVSGSGTMLGLVGASSPSDAGGALTVHYTDGSSSSYNVVLDNYFFSPDTGNTIVVEMRYINDSNPRTNGGSPQRNHPGWIFSTTVPLTSGKTVKAVTLPTGGGEVNGRLSGMHVFALGIG